MLIAIGAQLRRQLGAPEQLPPGLTAPVTHENETNEQLPQEITVLIKELEKEPNTT
jgi:hypothetical protein